MILLCAACGQSASGTVSPKMFGLMQALPCDEAAPQLPFSTTRLWDTSCAGVLNHWAQIETARGVYSWDSLDRAVQQFPGFDMVYTFADVPAWANGSSDRSVPPTDLQDLYDFVTAIVAHAGGKIRYWDAWNEFSRPVWWSGSSSQMLELTKGIYKAVKAVDPGAQVLCPSADGYEGLAAEDAFLAAGGGAYCDILNIHGYAIKTEPDMAPEQIWNIVSTYKSEFAYYKVDHKPFWADEGSFGAVLNGDTPQAAAYTSIYLLLMASGGVDRVIWYQYGSTASWGDLYSATAPDHLNQSGAAFRETQGWLTGASFELPVEREAATNQVRNPDASGAVAGTPGTLPANWSSYVPDAVNGISTQVVGAGTEDGIPYLDWHVFGTAAAAAAGYAQIAFETATQIPAAPGQSWTPCIYARRVAGSGDGVNVALEYDQSDANGASVGASLYYPFTPQPYPLSSQLQCYAGFVSDAATSYVRPFLNIAYPVGTPIDITLRIGRPTMDAGTTWSGVVTKPGGYRAKIAWDAAGISTPMSVPSNFRRYRDLTGQVHAIPDDRIVKLGRQPVIFENSPP